MNKSPLGLSILSFTNPVPFIDFIPFRESSFILKSSTNLLLDEIAFSKFASQETLIIDDEVIKQAQIDLAVLSIN